ncbi:MAG: hypothetical protein K2Y56_22425 [Methylobacterium sp.]|uniref:thermonuclease family protein n=1 Tax=Methylobacterium sp. TaxID=409 RepID=UPI0025E1B30A|nr:hypothetical protein [Methylobacterium sp.]MBX9934236.1 hypothetical protein [Methylobacterium sp.]
MSLDAASDPADPVFSDASAGEEAAWASERERLRSLIAAAIDRAGPQPIARRTLALLIEARLDAIAEPPGYRVVDRDGSVRLNPETGGPLTLDDLIEEFRHDKPSLFKPAEPEPAAAPAREAPASEPKPKPKPWAKPSARMRSFVAESRQRGLTLASAGSDWIKARSATRAAVAISAPEEPAARTASIAKAPAPWRRQVRRTGLRLRYGSALLWSRSRDRLQRGLDDARDAMGAGGILRRPSLIAALVGVGILGLLTLIFSGDRSSETQPATPDPRVAEAPQRPTVESAPEPVQQPSTPTAPQTVPPRSAEAIRPPTSDEEPPPDDAPMQGEVVTQPGGISGKVEVIDTATLKVNGKVVRLFGVVWVRGGQGEELARYLGNRSVSCQPVAGSDAHLCSVDGRDLSEVVLFNGGGRASPEATPDLVAAEDRARTERLGVWAR